jgi:hypothetical protein
VSAAFQVLAGWFLADLLGGVFHWFVDHKASASFFLTRAVVRDFREHHDDPLSMERYSRIPSLLLGLAGILPFAAAAVAAGLPWLGGTLVVGGLLTQHAHYYAHMPAPPSWARLLQQLGVFISPEAHRRHHGDFHRSYGVFNGWSHGVLDLILGRRY